MHASQRSEAGWIGFERECLLWGFPKPLASWEMLLLWTWWKLGQTQICYITVRGGVNKTL